MAPKNRRNNAPANHSLGNINKHLRSNASSALSTPGPLTPATETPPPTKAEIKDSIKVNTDITSASVNPAILDRPSPGVRDVAEHAAILKLLLSRLDPIFELVKKETERMEEVSPFLVAKNQVDEARNRLAAESQKREDKVQAIKAMIEVEKQRFLVTINEHLENMIRDVVARKIKESVKQQVAALVEPYRKILQGSKGRTMRNRMFLADIEAKNQNATIRSRFPHERIAPFHRPISVEFQISQSPTDSPKVGPAGGYHPSASPKFPETFGALMKLSLSDSVTLMKEYGLEADVSKKRNEEGRLENLNKLMSYFGIGYRLHPGPARKGPIITSLWDRR